MQCVAYVRVSSKEQEREGFSIPAQISLLEDYATKNGLEVAKVFTENETAKKTGRKSFNEMLNFIKEKQINIMRKYCKRKTAVVYYRISKKARNDMRMQKKVCSEFCSEKNIRIIGEYVDDGFSGRTKKRPGLKKLIEEMDQKKADNVLVYKIDRLGRNFNLLNDLLETFEKKNVTFLSATQNFDSTPEGKFMLRIFMLLAEFESNVTSARTIDGLRASKQEELKIQRV
jgi:DNA invertase Pin-like site-specific DNA recombinase